MFSFRIKLFLLVFSVIFLMAFAILWFNVQNRGYKPGVSAIYDKAVNQARAVYKDKRAVGTDFSNGPCISNNLFPEWVADTVHRPRVDSDNLPKNQCLEYLEGRAKHFVELDLEGNVVRVR